MTRPGGEHRTAHPGLGDLLIQGPICSSRPVGSRPAAARVSRVDWASCSRDSALGIIGGPAFIEDQGGDQPAFFRAFLEESDYLPTRSPAHRNR